MSLSCSLTIEFEGRETQAAESWRIQRRCESDVEDQQKETLAILRFYSHHQVQCIRGNLSVVHECEGARYAVILEVNLQAKPVLNFQSESLILAQNERWRQA